MKSLVRGPEKGGWGQSGVVDVRGTERGSGVVGPVRNGDGQLDEALSSDCPLAVGPGTACGYPLVLGAPRGEGFPAGSRLRLLGVGNGKPALPAHRDR